MVSGLTMARTIFSNFRRLPPNNIFAYFRIEKSVSVADESGHERQVGLLG